MNQQPKKKEPKEKAPGHGRNAASDYPGAQRVKVAWEGKQSGSPCPECPNGKVYFQSEPATLVRVRGVAPFITGHNHAGENLEAVLRHRAEDRSAPIQRCDALAANTVGEAGELNTILAYCLAHARRRFVEVEERFPDEVRYLLESLKRVYMNDAQAKKEGMDPPTRLAFHQRESGPVMKDLETWLRDQIEERKVEPNSGLGQTITYMRKYWTELTLFLRQPAAPLDNNAFEAVIKKAIMHRKNSLFYKSARGARTGDAFMSLIHTAELNGAQPFDYLVNLLRHAKDVEKDLASWMPWNYHLAQVPISP